MADNLKSNEWLLELPKNSSFSIDSKTIEKMRIILDNKNKSEMNTSSTYVKDNKNNKYAIYGLGNGFINDSYEGKPLNQEKTCNDLKENVITTELSFNQEFRAIMEFIEPFADNSIPLISLKNSCYELRNKISIWEKMVKNLTNSSLDTAFENDYAKFLRSQYHNLINAKKKLRYLKYLIAENDENLTNKRITF